MIKRKERSMNKRIVLAVAAALFMAGMIGQGSVWAAELKIGYVDMAKIFGEYSKTKESEKVLEEKGRAKEADMKKMDDEIRKLKDEQALLSDKAKAEKQALIDNKIKALQDFGRKTRDELMKERNEKLGDIMKDVEKVVTDYSKETGYDIILDSRTLLYGKESYDSTAEILKRLNK